MDSLLRKIVVAEYGTCDALDAVEEAMDVGLPLKSIDGALDELELRAWEKARTTERLGRDADEQFVNVGRRGGRGPCHLAKFLGDSRKVIIEDS